MDATNTAKVFDEYLLTLARSGDRRAAERLAARWQPRLLRAANRILGEGDAARDAVMETWTGICRGWLRLDDPSRFPAWAFSILHRKCMDGLRLKYRSARREAALDSAPEVAAMNASDPEARIGLRQALAALSPELRAAAVLYFAEGLSLQEVAAAAAIPLGTAKSRIFTARQQLRARLEGETK